MTPCTRLEPPFRIARPRDPLSIRVVSPSTISRVSDTWPPSSLDKSESLLERVRGRVDAPLHRDELHCGDLSNDLRLGAARRARRRIDLVSLVTLRHRAAGADRGSDRANPIAED